MPASFLFVGLHYWAGAGHEFNTVAQRLAPDFAFVAPDLPGFGAAPASADGYSVDAYADFVAHLIAEQQPEQYVLVGHSMGGKIALALAARQPAGLVGVALLSPSPPGPEPMSDEDREKQVRAYGKPAEAEKTFQHITARSLPPAVHQQIREDNLRSSREAWDAWLRRGSRENLRARMGRLQVPALLLVGEQDPVLTPAVQRQQTLPWLPHGTALDVIPGAGHLLPYEAPGEVAARLRAFAQHVLAGR